MTKRQKIATMALAGVIIGWAGAKAMDYGIPGTAMWRQHMMAVDVAAYHDAQKQVAQFQQDAARYPETALHKAAAHCAALVLSSSAADLAAIDRFGQRNGYGPTPQHLRDCPSAPDTLGDTARADLPEAQQTLATAKADLIKWGLTMRDYWHATVPAEVLAMLPKAKP